MYDLILGFIAIVIAKDGRMKYCRCCVRYHRPYFMLDASIETTRYIPMQSHSLIATVLRQYLK